MSYPRTTQNTLKLFAANIAYEATPEELEAAIAEALADYHDEYMVECQREPRFRVVAICPLQPNGVVRGFGFVEFRGCCLNVNDALDAVFGIKLHGRTVRFDVQEDKRA